MKAKIVEAKSLKEFPTDERCSIRELLNQSDSENLSIAIARVEEGIRTQLHYLEGVDEKYLIISGKGRVEIGNLQPINVEAGDMVVIPAGTSQRITNIGNYNLLFYCVCTPRFKPNCYKNLEENEN